jgi:hypothetical protein
MVDGHVLHRVMTIGSPKEDRREGQLVHFAVPAIRWWENIAFA